MNWRLRRKLHTSWLIALVSAALVVGVILAQYIDQVWFGSLSWLLLGIFFIIVACWKQWLAFIPLVLVGGIFIGLWRGSIEQSQLAVYEKLYGSQATIAGKVSDDADIGKKGELNLRLTELVVSGHAIAGNAWVTLSSSGVDIKRGDIVTVDGKLQPGFGNISTSVYQAKLKIVQRPEPGDVARQVRDWFADAVRTAVSEPEASLGIGYLVGQRRALPPDLSQALQIAGLTHVVVASGYNLTILVRLARRLFEKVSKYLSALAASTMILSFMAVTGASPSMSRAGLIAGLSLLAWYYGRSFHPLVLLPFAAAVTLLINPSYGWGDLGWQLSFAAFAGVMIVAPLTQRYFFGEKKPKMFRQILGETLAAQLVTLPILIMAFGQFSNVAVVANLLVLPLVPLAMLLTFLAGLGSVIMPSASQLIGLPASWLLTYMTHLAEFLAKLPWALSEAMIGGWQVTMAYGLIAAACFYMWRKTKYNFKNANLVE